MLVDFIGLSNKITGMNVAEGDLDAMDKGQKNAFWKKIIAYVNQGHPFFGAMLPLPDAMHLWQYIKRHPHFILTAAGKRIPNADPEKRQWVRSHLGTVHVEVVDSAKAKARFAAPNVVLIDDRAKCIDPWVAAGGVGILHTTATSTIQKLKELGL